MKSFMKKIIVTMCAISAVLALSTTALATEGFRTGPDNAATATETSNVAVQDTAPAENNAREPVNVTAQAGAQNLPVNKYLTKWGGFFWFLLSVIVNFFLSCWIGNRFYRLARRSAQSSSEIRALRKDIEEKFASTLKDINEPVTEVVNRNENYARTDEGVEMPQRKASVEINEDEREILGRWDAKRTVARGFAAAEEEAEAQSEGDSRRAYAPTREMSGIEFEDDEETLPQQEKSQIRQKMDAAKKAGNKAKDLLSNIFPFDE